MGRPRSAGRRDLPANLDLHAASGLYRYRHPQTRQRHYLGRDKAAAISAANQLNAILLRRVSAVDRIVGRGRAFRTVVAWYRDERTPKMELAPKTRSERLRMCHVLERLLASRHELDRPIDEMTVLDCASILEHVTAGARARPKYRALLMQIFTEAGAEGWVDDNPAARTRDEEPGKVRRTLTLEWYRLIHAQAPVELQCAMDLALQTLQRREDISTMLMPKDGRIRFVQGKTGKALELDVSPEIQAIVERCLALGVVCPFIVRMKPRAARASDRRAKARQHFAQILPEQLSRGFAEARDRLALFQAMPMAERPSFHEIRGLGGVLYKQLKGWSDDQVQALMGHADVDMTRVYIGQHEPVYQRVTPGLQL